MSDFSDRPFVAGTLTGIRSFRVERLGRLTAVSYQTEIWTPGENIAECLRAQGSVTWQIAPSWLPTIDPKTGGFHFRESEPPKPPPVSLVKKPKHRLTQLDCGCGFYGYFDTDSNPYHARGQVNGVIEAYGSATVGSRGFRAEKARIVALIIKPKRRGDALLERVVANYSVPIYESKAQALYHHPLTPPEIPTPETDAEFWTRPVSA